MWIYLIFSSLLILGCNCQNNTTLISTKINPLSNITMQFVIEYLIWRSIDHIIIFDPFVQKGEIPVDMVQLIDCLTKQGIYSATYSAYSTPTKEMFRVNRHRIGVIVLFRCDENIDQNHILIKASLQRMFDEQRAWLLISCGTMFGTPEMDPLLEKVRSIHLGLTSDVVVASAMKPEILTYAPTEMVVSGNGKRNTMCPLTDMKIRTFRSDRYVQEMQVAKSTRKSSQLVEKHARKIRDVFNDQLKNINKSTISDHKNNLAEKTYFDLTQVYKIRNELPESIIYSSMGTWNTISHFEKITQFVSVEGRDNFQLFPLIVGFKNWTSDSDIVQTKVTESDVDDTENLREIMDFIAAALNATVIYRSFTSVGSEVQEGVFTELLNAVVKNDVDFALEKVTVTYNKLDYMAFTHTIMKTSRNIYMHPSESSVSQDIYLTPFSPHLLLSVLAMAIILAFVMLIVSLVANYRAKKKKQDIETVNVSYASLWIIGILAMQGSIWTPVSSSGNMILISSLMFSLIIYNSYAAFITSILSVKTSDIKSLDDIYSNGYKVGYITNSQDEVYLQAQDAESDIKQIFYKGLNFRQNNIDAGLLAAARTKYALFVSTQAARRAIQDLNPYECRCQIQEFALRSTIDEVAFPLGKGSPYHKIINMGVMRLIESGTLSRIQTIMMPDMPTCTSDSSFVSAQLEDVSSAVFLLCLGIGLALLVAIIECVVKYRKEIKYNLKHCCGHMGRKLKTTVNNFEF